MQDGLIKGSWSMPHPGKDVLFCLKDAIRSLLLIWISGTIGPFQMLEKVIKKMVTSQLHIHSISKCISMEFWPGPHLYCFKTMTRILKRLAFDSQVPQHSKKSLETDFFYQYFHLQMVLITTVNFNKFNFSFSLHRDKELSDNFISSEVRNITDHYN